MREYRYQEIQEITKSGIVFQDGFAFLFKECRKEWCAKYRIKSDQSCCVAKRNIEAKPPYFLFYTKEKVKVLFDTKGILGRKRNEKDFLDLQFILTKFGYSSYDLT